MNTRERKTRQTRSDFDSLEQEVFLNLWRTYDRLRALEEKLFDRFDLTAQQYNVLRLLDRSHPESMQTLELAGQLVSRAPDITRILDKLTERSLVRRDRPTDDRRIVRVAITGDGQRLITAIRGPLAACHAAQLGHLSREDLTGLKRLLKAARAPHESKES